LIYRNISILTFAVATVASRAQAQTSEPPPDPPNPFGSGGQLVLSIDRLANVAVQSGSRKTTSPNGDGLTNCSGTSVAGAFFGTSPWGSSVCQPSGFGGVSWGADVFVADRISLGGSVTFAHDSSNNLERLDFGITEQYVDSSSSSVVLSPRIGYAHALGPKWTLWPRVGVDWVNASSEQAGYIISASGTFFQASEMSTHGVNAALDAKLIYSPIAHVGLFAGVFGGLPLWNRYETKLWGVTPTVGSSKFYDVGASVGALIYL
jgi:hypothetical protein